MAANVYDALVDVLQAHEVRPYAIMMGKREWRALQRDPRAHRHLFCFPGDPDTFMKVPIRIEKLKNPPRAFATAEDLHEELYGRR